jgi:hypothetical protein
MLGTIELSQDERLIASEVALATRELLTTHDYERAIKTGYSASALFIQLQLRKIIPEVRLRYFADASFNAGNTKSSKRELFLRNAGTEEEMYTHPHFWPYLLYFIHGPNLPDSVQKEFHAAASESFREWDTLRKLARKQAREISMERTKKAEAFFQLALDSECTLDEALGVRDAVMKIR